MLHHPSHLPVGSARQTAECPAVHTLHSRKQCHNSADLHVQNEPQGGAARRGRAACNRSVYSIASSCQGAQLGVEETRDRQAGSTTKKTSPTAGKRVAYVTSSVPSACGISSPDRGVSRCAHTAQQKAMPQQCRLACAPCAAGKVQPYRLAHRLPARPTPQLVDICGGEHSCVPS